MCSMLSIRSPHTQHCIAICGQDVWDIVATVIWQMLPNLRLSSKLSLLLLSWYISPCRDFISNMKSTWTLPTHSPLPTLPSVREKCDQSTLCHNFQVFVTCFAACVTEPPCCMTAMNEVADCMTPKPQDPRVYRSYSAQICAPSCPSRGERKKKKRVSRPALFVLRV